LGEGSRLPTHRELAWRLGVTVGTVTRAYAEAERIGLIGGEVGRGTYVRASRKPRGLGGLVAPLARLEADNALPMDVNYPTAPLAPQALSKTLAEIARDGDLRSLSGYVPRPGLEPHRRAGAAWIRRTGLETDPDRIVITPGSQHALMVALAALLRPGETLLTESLVWGGIKAIAGINRYRLHAVAMDADGLRPDALEAAIAETGARMLFVNPTLQNPTASIMPDRRRREIAAVVEKAGIYILEDDIYGPLVDPVPLPIAAYAPDRAIFVGGTSKTLGPGLRIAYLHAPAPLVEPIATALQATATMAAPLLAEVACRWIADGTAERCVRAEREEARSRQAIARGVLAGHDFHAPLDGLHLWLQLPEPWRADEFAAQLERQGVRVNPAEVFAAGRAVAPHAVRVCLGTVPDRATLKRGIEILRRTLDGVPSSRASVF
ncbi:MAG: PLP-dependent aminotransferase family protein, partial [Alphaproteobacteria bacterium]|nr:PLP-dependent aminotransferase family protein [Alphaproteobacteria bacterium]